MNLGQMWKIHIHCICKNRACIVASEYVQICRVLFLKGDKTTTTTTGNNGFSAGVNYLGHENGKIHRFNFFKTEKQEVMVSATQNKGVREHSLLKHHEVSVQLHFAMRK